MVRIYKHNGTAPCNINTSYIEKFKTHISNRVRYFTDKGIYELNGNILRKIIINNGQVHLLQAYHNNSEINVIVDESTETLSEEVYYQIPFGYIRDNIEVITYRIVEHAQPKLVVIKGENGTVLDYYVESTMNVDCPEVLETISTLLMKL